MARVSLRSVNFPDRFVRHSNFLGEVTPVGSDMDRFDSTFNVVPGLTGDGCVSFESVNFPNHFLRHLNFRMRLDARPSQGDGLFDADATFRPEGGLTGGNSCSFRSFNHPDRFIRHRDFHLFLEPANIAADASFIAEPGFISDDGDTVIFDSGPLTSGVPLGGSVHVIIRRNGVCTFSCHAHDSGFDNIDYTVSAVIMTPTGKALTFQRSGHVEGTVAGLPFGTPQRNDDFEESSTNSLLLAEWGAFTVAKMRADISGTNELVGGLSGILSELVTQLATELVKDAAAEVVAVVAG